MSDDRLLSEHLVWMEYGLSIPWQRKKRRVGDGPAFLKIGRLVRYRREDIEEFLRSCMIERFVAQNTAEKKKAADSRSAAQAEVRDGHATLQV